MIKKQDKETSQDNDKGLVDNPIPLEITGEDKAGNEYRVDMTNIPTPERIKMTPDEIRAMAATIDADAMAGEVMAWLIANVEQYIDNQETTFRMYLTLESGEKMPMCHAVQQMYMGIPEDLDDADVLAELYDLLEGIVSKAGDALSSDTTGLAQLFKRMIFFYEMTAFSREVGPIIQEMEGSVTINEFMFDTVPIAVKVTKRMRDQFSQKQVGESESVKEVYMPEAFGVELTLNHWAKPAATSMY